MRKWIGLCLGLAAFAACIGAGVFLQNQMERQHRMEEHQRRLPLMNAEECVYAFVDALAEEDRELYEVLCAGDQSQTVMGNDWEQMESLLTIERFSELEREAALRYDGEVCCFQTVCRWRVLETGQTNDMPWSFTLVFDETREVWQIVNYGF